MPRSSIRLGKQSFVIDGQAVVLGPDGISDFEDLHSVRCNEEVRLYARGRLRRERERACARFARWHSKKLGSG